MHESLNDPFPDIGRVANNVRSWIQSDRRTTSRDLDWLGVEAQQKNSTAQGDFSFGVLFGASNRVGSLSEGVEMRLRLAGVKPNSEAIRKRHLRKYNGIPHHHFHLFIKECEWRFNYGSPAQLLKTLAAWIRLTNKTVS